MAFESLMMILETCREKEIPFWEAILLDDMNERNANRQESMEQMRTLWHAMQEAADRYDGNLRSNSGFVGGAGRQMEEYVKKGDTLCGSFVGTVIAGALQMGESNACMKRIVAAPTAGAMVHLQGGNEEQIAHGAAMAVKNLLGLVCDPVAGLVEVPCVKRNVAGAVIALSSADMALAGIKSRISPDQVIDAMKEVGDLMDVSLKETGRGGLAGTKEGQEMAEALE